MQPLRSTKTGFSTFCQHIDVIFSLALIGKTIVFKTHKKKNSNCIFVLLDKNNCYNYYRIIRTRNPLNCLCYTKTLKKRPWMRVLYHTVRQCRFVPVNINIHFLDLSVIKFTRQTLGEGCFGSRSIRFALKFRN